MTGKNERKLEILHFIDRAGESTSYEVAEELYIEISNARKLLAHYWKQELLHRRIIDQKTRQRAYSISKKGLERIDWLEGW